MSLTFHSLLIASLPFIIIFIFLKPLFSPSKPHTKNPPPSPPRLPLIGNLHQLGSKPHRTFQSMSETYGPLMLIRLGTKPVLVASSADSAREIMKTHDLIFSNRPKSNVSSRLFYGSKDIAFSQYGEYWRQIKSIAVLHLLTTKRVQSFREVREDEVGVIIERICENGYESEVNLSELLITLTNNVICRVAFGRRYGGKKFKGLLERFVELLGSFSVGSYIPWLMLVDRLSGLERKTDEVAKEFDEFLEGVIEEHVSKKEVIGSETQDLVDILLEVQRDDTNEFRLERDVIKAIILVCKFVDVS